MILAVALLMLWQGRTAWDFSAQSAGQTEPELQGEVIQILGEEEVLSGPDQVPILEQRLSVRLPDGRVTEVINDFAPVDEGDDIFIRGPFLDETGGETYAVAGVGRSMGIFILAAIFVGVVLFITGKKGAYALIGLTFTMAVIIAFIIPLILRGFDPILVGIVGAGGCVLVTLYTAYGVNRKSVAALIGIIIALGIVALTAQITVHALNFTGLAEEESAFLLYQTEAVRNFVGLLVAGIIIAGLGVLDDVAVTQAATVEEIHRANPNLRGYRLFQRAMNVGRDHISAVINTLVLAYTGSALPLLLLISFNQFSSGFLLSNELVAEEIVRTIISSLGLVLAVPITTGVAIALIERFRFRGEA